MGVHYAILFTFQCLEIFKITIKFKTWYQHINIQSEQRRKQECPEITPNTYGGLIYDKGDISNQ